MKKENLIIGIAVGMICLLYFKSKKNESPYLNAVTDLSIAPNDPNNEAVRIMNAEMEAQQQVRDAKTEAANAD